MAARTNTAARTTRSRTKVITPDGEPDEHTGPDTDEDLTDEAPDEDEDDEDDAELVVPEELTFESDAEAREDRAEDPGTPFMFDGKTYLAYRPKDAVMVTLMAAGSSGATVGDQVQAVLRWLDHCLEPTAQMALSNRIYDREDKLEWDDLAEVMLKLLAYWEAHPIGGNRSERRAKAAAASKAAAAKETALRTRRRR